jgi:hypothetical protein
MCPVLQPIRLLSQLDSNTLPPMPPLSVPPPSRPPRSHLALPNQCNRSPHTPATDKPDPSLTNRTLADASRPLSNSGRALRGRVSHANSENLIDAGDVDELADVFFSGNNPFICSEMSFATSGSSRDTLRLGLIVLTVNPSPLMDTAGQRLERL